MRKLQGSYVFIFLFLFGSSLFAQEIINCDYIIEPDELSITELHTNPGDTLCILAGQRPHLYLKNINGNEDSAVVIINYGGQVRIYSEHYYGLKFAECNYVRLTGTGDSDFEYGILIDTVALGDGINVSSKSSDFEIDHINIQKTKNTGILAKSDPNCTFTTVRDSFTMYNVHLHHNYLEDIGTEGIYVGNSFFLGMYLSSCDTTILPHLVEGVSIHHNQLYRIGWDGIQVGCALNGCDIFNNEIFYDSQKEQTYQMSGVMVNTGSRCDVHDHIIVDGMGTGIINQGAGGQKFYNNLIINAGRNFKPDDQYTSQQFGIFSKYSYILPPDSSFLFFNNTIINPKSDGIRFYNSHSSNNLFYNNIIINPGAFAFYDTNGSVNNIGEDAYIHNYLDESEIIMSRNIFERSAADQFFEDTLTFNYRLTSHSPAFNRGSDISDFAIFHDLDGNIRPYDDDYDVGAYELQSAEGLFDLVSHSNYLELAPNPSIDFLEIEIPSQLEKNAHLEILNPSGKNIYTKYIYPSRGASFIYETSDLPGGLYFVVIKSGEQNYFSKFIKL